MNLGKKYISLKNVLNDFWKNESGATAIEYGLIAALIALGMIVGLQTLGGGNEGSWQSIADKVEVAMEE